MATLIHSWGGNGSNVYVSFSAANSYITNAAVNASAWTDATTAKREAALLEATIDIDANQYIGHRYWYDQTLEFPREVRSDFPWNRTESGSTTYSVTHQRMEDDVKRACALQALWILQHDGISKHARNQAQGVKSYFESVGPIRESVKYNGIGGGGANPLSPRAKSLIAEWRTSRRIYRG